MPKVRSCARMLSRYSRWLRAARRGSCRRAASAPTTSAGSSGADRIVGLSASRIPARRGARAPATSPRWRDSSNSPRSTASASRRAPAGRRRGTRGRGAAPRRRGAPRRGAGSVPAGRKVGEPRVVRRPRVEIRAPVDGRMRSSDAPLARRRAGRAASSACASVIDARPRSGRSAMAGPSKFTQRLFSVRPASWRASACEGRSTSTRCRLPTIDSLIARACALSRCLQSLEPLLLHLVRDVIRQRGRGRARAGGCR